MCRSSPRPGGAYAGFAGNVKRFPFAFDRKENESAMVLGAGYDDRKTPRAVHALDAGELDVGGG
jgi:hypothetical protein